MRKQFTLLMLVLLVSTNWLIAQIPTGYYTNAAGLTGAPLKTALYNIIKDHTAVSYAAVWSAYYTTDKKANGKIWDIYSDVPGGTPPYEYTLGSSQCGSYSAEGNCYNREHSFPKSWFNDGTPMITDIFHLYPTDGYVNGHRSNYPYGTVSSPSWTSKNGCKLGPCSAPGYTGIVFEPINEYKGDIARTYFYMVTRYENVVASWNSNAEAQPTLDGTTYPCFDPWILSVLLAWNAADPVSQKEIDRNNAVFAIQHNRNPYIDHPEYATSVWGGSSIAAEPTNQAMSFTVSSSTSTTLTLTWSDNDGAQPAGNFLILASTTGSFTNPADAVIYSDDLVLSDNAGDVNVNHAIQTYTWSGLTPSTTYYFKIFPYSNTGTAANYKADGTVPAVNGTTLAAAAIAAAPAMLTGFSYVAGSGPSSSQSYLLSAAGLTPSSGNITVTGTTDFEVSADNSSFANSLEVAYTGGTLTATPIYIWLKSGLQMGSYLAENISVTGGGANASLVSCSGNVTDYTGMSETRGIQGKAFVKQGYFNINVPGMEGKQAEIGIYNSMGQQYGKTKLVMQGIIQLQAPVVPGIYIVKVSTGKDFFTAKVSVSRK